MTPPEARALFSDYADGTLDTETLARLTTFLAADNTLRAEYDSFTRTLDMLHTLPAREPSLDLWREFAPHMAAYQAARHLSFPQRVRMRGQEFIAAVSAGLILWTHSLAARTHARLEQYLLRDPFHHTRRIE